LSRENVEKMYICEICTRRRLDITAFLLIQGAESVCRLKKVVIEHEKYFLKYIKAIDKCNLNLI